MSMDLAKAVPALLDHLRDEFEIVLAENWPAIESLGGTPLAASTVLSAALIGAIAAAMENGAGLDRDDAWQAAREGMEQAIRGAQKAESHVRARG